MQVAKHRTLKKDLGRFWIEKQNAHELAGEDEEILFLWNTARQRVNYTLEQAILHIFSKFLVEIIEDVGV